MLGLNELAKKHLNEYQAWRKTYCARADRVTGYSDRVWADFWQEAKAENKIRLVFWIVVSAIVALVLLIVALLTAFVDGHPLVALLEFAIVIAAAVVIVTSWWQLNQLFRKSDAKVAQSIYEASKKKQAELEAAQRAITKPHQRPRPRRNQIPKSTP